MIDLLKSNSDDNYFDNYIDDLNIENARIKACLVVMQDGEVD